MANDSNLRNQEEQEAQVTLGNDILVYLQNLLAQTSFYALPNQVDSTNKEGVPLNVYSTDWLVDMRNGLKYAAAEGSEIMYQALEPPAGGMSYDAITLRLNVANELIAMLDYKHRLNTLDTDLNESWEKMFSINGMNAKIESCVKIDDRVELPGDIISTQVTEELRCVTANDMQQIGELRAKIQLITTEIDEKCKEVLEDWLPPLTRNGTTALHRTVRVGSAPGDYNRLLEIVEQRRSLIERMGKKQWPGIKYSMEFEREFNSLNQEY